MENLRRIIGMYFQKISSHNILSGELRYNEFNKEDFDALSRSALPCMSDTDTNQLYLYLKQNVDENADSLNVFTALKILANEYLMIRNNQPLVRYNHILSWRTLTKQVGEDLPICAFLAYRKQKTGYDWNDFEWSTVIGHDNMQVNRIMQRGISDNHFHLFGSAPSFQLIWIQLMNNLQNDKYLEGLTAIDRDKRLAREHYSKKYAEDSFEMMYFQAVLIRVIIFSYIYDIDIPFIGSTSNIDESRGRKKIVENAIKIQSMLTNDASINLWSIDIQNYINSLNYLKIMKQKDDTDDYANIGLRAQSINHEFEGERALTYRMLCGDVDGEPIPSFLMNWFYAYLSIQIKFREELVQVNQTIGFENFSEYTRRKGKFLYTTSDDKKMIQHAVRGSFESGNIKSLELRITPCETAEMNSSWIKTCDKFIDECSNNDYKKNYYYVFHFPKKKDEDSAITSGILVTCRHYKYRVELKKKADQLIRFRNNYPDEAERVKGIDACAQEIGCRPEVFATVFRRLAGHVAQESYNSKVQQWKITYHVGEDGMDFADGLRAIDEAIRFLDMKNGDRLGHATFLGLDVKKWYHDKCDTIYLPLQDYLDNVVWLYHKLIEFDIASCETLKAYLNVEYDRCFKMLYGDCMQNSFMSYGIHTYYEAWKHRDADPQLYETGKWRGTIFADFGQNTSQYVSEEQWYHKDEIVKLLYYYHYSADVRYKKNITEKIIVPEIFIDGVEKVQKAMQYDIAEKGICVETNPSSNLVISSMKKYDEHPIVNLCNLGLTLNADEINSCAQIHVSINTDDKGVFHTSLENEYALMGRALEKMTNEQGNRRYSKQMVYDWMERIRQNGNQQSFLERIEEPNKDWRTSNHYGFRYQSSFGNYCIPEKNFCINEKTFRSDWNAMELTKFDQKTKSSTKSF